MKFSKNVKHGSLVTKHGEKYVLCGSHRTPFGVFINGHSNIYLTDCGVIRVEIPTGIQVSGQIIMNVSEEQ